MIYDKTPDASLMPLLVTVALIGIFVVTYIAGIATGYYLARRKNKGQ